jgi:translation elongation factor EF-Tu-like GTPase
MYLESIFVGSEDIRRQLPTESSLFDQVNADWISTTARMEAVKIAYKATHLDGVLELLTKMDETLDRIQKSLDEYLETKRQAFPRFYFLSNDDLLEILGQVTVCTSRVEVERTGKTSRCRSAGALAQGVAGLHQRQPVVHAGMGQHLRLHIKFLTRDQIKLGEALGHHRAHVLLDVGGRRVAQCLGDAVLKVGKEIGGFH